MTLSVLLSVYRYEGVFRKSCEIVMNVMRTNRDMLMNVLHTFVHDPLVEWEKSRSNNNSLKIMNRIEMRLRGQVRQRSSNLGWRSRFLWYAQ